MTKKSVSRFITAPLVFVVWFAADLGLPAGSYAQVSSTKSNPVEKPHAHRAPPRVYEDDEIRLRIPPDWTMLNSVPPEVKPYACPERSLGMLGNSITYAKRKLLLKKDGYTLALAFDTEHASGVSGGRFGEMLNIPWFNDEVGICGLSMSGYPLPASRTLIFYDLVLDTGRQEVREGCGISKDLSYKTEQGFTGERRWFAGYFTTAYPWFFSSAGEGCGLKAYTLTTDAKTPEELPDDQDPKLRSVIQQAIDIVDSIHYKRCPPSPEE